MAGLAFRARRLGARAPPTQPSALLGASASPTRRGVPAGDSPISTRSGSSWRARSRSSRELLLLDEWLAGLNPTELEDGIALVRSLRDEGLDASSWSSM